VSPTHALIRTTPGGVHTLYLATPFTAITRAPALPTNPDFGVTLPPTINSNPLDRLAVDRTNDALYAAVNFTSAAPQQPWVFRCRDGNADGDANDAGEVTMFYDGTTGPVAMTSIDDIEWHNGKLYVSHEFPAGSQGPCQFVELSDSNNDGDAMDANEQVVRQRRPAQQRHGRRRGFVGPDLRRHSRGTAGADDSVRRGPVAYRRLRHPAGAGLHPRGLLHRLQHADVPRRHALGGHPRAVKARPPGAIR
jgi:hypothetical protein